MLSGPIDVDYNFRLEPRCAADPDPYSPTLLRYQRLLLTKELPSGEMFTLEEMKTGSYHLLVHQSGLGRFVLSSDTILNSNMHACAKFYAQLPEEENLRWRASGIAARVMFPFGGRDGEMSVNQKRGMDHKIKDRFDLTLECIRRHYQGGDSPLTDTLAQHAGFFALFETFRAYVEFFLLQDWVDEDFNVRFYLGPFTEFTVNPLPKTFEDYVTFRHAQLERFEGRNRRINDYQDRRLR